MILSGEWFCAALLFYWQRGRIGKCSRLENGRPKGHVGSRPTAVVYL
jgi:hypothetical protein